MQYLSANGRASESVISQKAGSEQKPLYSDHLRSLIAYGTVSVLTVCLELLVLHGMLRAHAGQSIAISVGFTSSSLFQFLVLRYVVFKVTHQPVIFQANAYLLAGLVAWALVLIGVKVLTAIFPLETFEARMLLLPVLFPVNYLISRFFVFRS